MMAFVSISQFVNIDSKAKNELNEVVIEVGNMTKPLEVEARCHLKYATCTLKVGNFHFRYHVGHALVIVDYNTISLSSPVVRSWS